MPNYFIRYKTGLREAGTGKPDIHFISLSAPSRPAAIEAARARRGIRMEQITEIVETPDRPAPQPPPERKGKLVVRINRVRLDRGGYDSQGRYFGAGKPLFMYYADEEDLYGHVRASDKAEAKEKVRREVLRKTALRADEFAVR